MATSSAAADRDGTASAAEAAPALQLEYLEIKDVEDTKQRLLETLDGPSPVRIGVGRVSTVDTAGVQLLLAFKAEAAKRSVSVEFCGDSPLLNNALGVLGLRDGLTTASRRD